jgi:hypothetical protein
VGWVDKEFFGSEMDFAHFKKNYFYFPEEKITRQTANMLNCE